MHRLIACALLLGACALPDPKDDVQQLASVADAPNHDPKAKFLRFSGEPKPEFLGTKRWSSGGNRSRMRSRRQHAAVSVPVVPPGWTKSDPVPLWIRLDERTMNSDGPDMQKDVDALVAAMKAGPIEVKIMAHLEQEVDMKGTNAHQIMPRLAMEEHGLSSPVGVPLTKWPSPGR